MPIHSTVASYLIVKIHPMLTRTKTERLPKPKQCVASNVTRLIPHLCLHTLSTPYSRPEPLSMIEALQDPD